MTEQLIGILVGVLILILIGIGVYVVYIILQKLLPPDIMWFVALALGLILFVVLILWLLKTFRLLGMMVILSSCALSEFNPDNHPYNERNVSKVTQYGDFNEEKYAVLPRKGLIQVFPDIPLIAVTDNNGRAHAVKPSYAVDYNR